MVSMLNITKMTRKQQLYHLTGIKRMEVFQKSYTRTILLIEKQHKEVAPTIFFISQEAHLYCKLRIDF